MIEGCRDPKEPLGTDAGGDFVWYAPKTAGCTGPLASLRMKLRRRASFDADHLALAEKKASREKAMEIAGGAQFKGPIEGPPQDALGQITDCRSGPRRAHRRARTSGSLRAAVKGGGEAMRTGPHAAGWVLAASIAMAFPPAAFGEEPWRAKADASSHVPDWSKADETDGAAAAYFIERVWPQLGKAAAALDGRIVRDGKPVQTGAVYSGKMSDAEKAAGVVCFPLQVEQVLPWHAVPAEAQVADRGISTFAARGQSEAVCIGVHALRDVRNVSVACGDLKGPGVIPASAITVRLSLSYTVNPRFRDQEIHARQMLLLKVAGWDIAKGRTHEWAVDVHVPADAAPGVYRGTVAVDADGKRASDFDLEIEVLPFELTDNGCRWGAFMTPNPGHTTEAWCDLNSRYGLNTLAWWNLDAPALTWTWDGMAREELVLAKIRNAADDAYPGGEKGRVQAELANMVNSFPDWLKKRQDGTFFAFRPDEVVGLPKNIEEREPFYKKQLQLKPELGDLTEEQRKSIRYDRPGWSANFGERSVDSAAFEQNDAFRQFDAGMKRLKKHGFAGPVTWFGSGGPTEAWETRVISQRFGQKYSRKDWKWRPEVTAENTNHVWYLANAAVAKTFDRARRESGWPEVVWCPCDESFQYRGASGRSATCMIAEMMPYIRRYAPDFRVYSVVWHTKEDNWHGLWQCGTLQKIKTRDDGSPSHQYGPFQVICTNCPNDLDRAATWEAGGEYWMYTLIYAVTPSFGAARFGMGFKGARHLTAVTYSYADGKGAGNLRPGQDVARSDWIGGEAQMNFYLCKDPSQGQEIDYAIASHAALAARQGVTDRKYVETLRVLAHRKGDAGEIAYLNGLGAKIDSLGGGKGGIDDFAATVTDESGPQKLRREIAYRIKALVGK